MTKKKKISVARCCSSKLDVTISFLFIRFVSFHFDIFLFLSFVRIHFEWSRHCRPFDRKLSSRSQCDSGCKSAAHCAAAITVCLRVYVLRLYYTLLFVIRVRTPFNLLNLFTLNSILVCMRVYSFALWRAGPFVHACVCAHFVFTESMNRPLCYSCSKTQ